MPKTIAKDKLSWQTGEITDLQTEIKILIKKMILRGASKQATATALYELIDKGLKRVKSPEMKNKSREVLLRFAERVYAFLWNTYQGATLGLLGAMTRVAEYKGTQKDKRAVYDFANKTDILGYNISIPIDKFSQDYMALVKKRMEFLSTQEAKDDPTSRVSLRNIAEMQIRAEHNEAMIDGLKSKGIKLAWILPHANCSKRCEKWQGKLYSLDGTSGQIDGYSYQPLENAMNVYEVTRGGKIYRNGCISGFNCRHILEPYKDKNKPIEIPAEVVNKTREIETKQRYMENMTRKWKERFLLLDKGKEKELARIKALKWEQVYKDFSRKNDMPFYESRIKII